MTNRIELWQASSISEKAFDWCEWLEKIPYIKFPGSWNVKIVPPFAGAMVRFMVKKSDEIRVSVYLDCHELLGVYSGPYWEVYPFPYQDEDGSWRQTNHRIAMNDTEELIKCIQQSLDYQGIFDEQSSKGLE